MQILKLSIAEKSSYIIAIITLWSIFYLQLLAALLSGMLIYQIIQVISIFIEYKITKYNSNLIAAVLLFSIIIIIFIGIIISSSQYFEYQSINSQIILDKFIVIIKQIYSKLPKFITSKYLQINEDQIKIKIAELIQNNSKYLQKEFKNILRLLSHIIIGIIIGLIISIKQKKYKYNLPLSNALFKRLSFFSYAFKGIVFAQFKISIINSFLTGIYLILILPIIGIYIPFAKILVFFTFIVGLLPVIGNLISNIAIVAIALTVSLSSAILSLTFLILIHKFEYFLNAYIIGNQIKANTWELLIVMLVMESAFGLSGMIATPIFYAYVKRELEYLRLI